MKRKGFTLIELLAVIVILAVIALIAIPIVLNIVEKSRKEAFRDTVYEVIEAISMDAMIDKSLPISYVVADNEITPTVSMSGKIGAFGEVTVNAEGKTKVELDNGTWCARKGFDDRKVELSSSPCTDNPIIAGNVTVEPVWGEGLLVTSTATSNTSRIMSYEFTVKKQNEVIATYESAENEHLFSFEPFKNNEQYQFEVVVKDNQNNIAEANTTYLLSYEPVITRYVVVEVYEHLAGNGAAINELEFYNADNEKVSYTVTSAYDSVTKGNPFYWTSTSYWQKEHLNDGKYSYSSNSDGGGTSTLFIYDSSATGKWARFLVDFGESTEIKTINLYTGGSDKRQPHQIKMYQYGLEPDSDFKKTYIDSRDDSLSCIYDKTFTSAYTTPTKDTNYFIYPKDTENPVIKEISTTTEINLLKVKAEVVDPYYSSGIKQYRFALVKDQGTLSYNQIPWGEVQHTESIEYDLSALENGTYYIYVEATDNASNQSYKVSPAYTFSKKDVDTRYLVVEIDDHFASNGSVVTELEFYNKENQKLTYDVPKVYDQARNGVPYYWTSTAWPKTKLYDGKTTYTSNSQGNTTSTIFNYSSTAGAGVWTRMLVDFSSVKNVSDIKIWLGGPEGRTPKVVHFYVTEMSDANSIYDQNIKVRENTSLIEVARYQMTSDLPSVRMLERSSLMIYSFKKK